MNMHRLLGALVVLLLTGGFGGGVYAASPKEEYELQERCGKRATEIFEKLGGHLDGGAIKIENGQSLMGFQNHYSKRLNKCFMLLTTTSYTTVQKKTTSNTLINLFAVNENKDYGSIFKRNEDTQ